MLNIEKNPQSPPRFHALLPLDEAIHPAETFTLAGTRTRITAADASEDPPPEGLRLQFTPSDPDLVLADRHGRFSEAERDNILCLLASPDGRFGSLRINAAAQIYSCRLGADQQILFRRPAEHHLWLRTIAGKLEVNGQALDRHAIATVSDESEITISALRDSEFLLLTLGRASGLDH